MPPLGESQAHGGGAVTLVDVWVTPAAVLAGTPTMASLTWLAVGWLCLGSSARVLCCGFEVLLSSLAILTALVS